MGKWGIKRHWEIPCRQFVLKHRQKLRPFPSYMSCLYLLLYQEYLYPDLVCVHSVVKPVVLKGCYTFLLHLSFEWFSRNICDNFCFLTSPHIINLESVVLPGKQILYFAAIFSIFMGFLFYHSDYYYVVEMQMTNKIKFAYGWLWLALCTCYAWLIAVPLGRVPPSRTNC